MENLSWQSIWKENIFAKDSLHLHFCKKVKYRICIYFPQQQKNTIFCKKNSPVILEKWTISSQTLWYLMFICLEERVYLCNEEVQGEGRRAGRISSAPLLFHQDTCSLVFR